MLSGTGRQVPAGATQYSAYPPPATSADPVGDMVLGALSGFDNRSRNFEPHNVGCTGRRRIKAAPLEDVRPVHSGGRNLDQHFARPRPRNAPFDDGKLLRPVGLGTDDCLHRSGNGVGHAGRLLTEPALGSNASGMDIDDLFPSKPGDPLVELAKQDLDPMSIEELVARIESLKAEIARVETHMARAQAHRSAAEDLFKK